MLLGSLSAESATSQCFCKVGQGTESSPKPTDPGDKQTQTRAECVPEHVGADVGGHVVLGSALPLSRLQVLQLEGGRRRFPHGASGAWSYCPLLLKGGIGTMVGLT